MSNYYNCFVIDKTLSYFIYLISQQYNMAEDPNMQGMDKTLDVPLIVRTYNAHLAHQTQTQSRPN